MEDRWNECTRIFHGGTNQNTWTRNNTMYPLNYSHVVQQATMCHLTGYMTTPLLFSWSSSTLVTQKPQLIYAYKATLWYLFIAHANCCHTLSCVSLASELQIRMANWWGLEKTIDLEPKDFLIYVNISRKHLWNGHISKQCSM